MLDLIQIKNDLNNYCDVIYCETHPVIPGVFTLKLYNILSSQPILDIIHLIKSEYSISIIEDISDESITCIYANSEYSED